MRTRAASILVLAALGLTTACHHPPPVVAATPPPAPVRAARAPSSPPPVPRPAVALRTAGPSAPSEAELFRRESLDQLNSDHPLADAFFDYDRDTLRDDAEAALQKDADWLRKWTQTRIRIEGHCDERGTAEYNLALGERRANTVRSYLVSLGVPAPRIDVVSLGKEAPFCSAGENDSCWSQNRRGHFLVTAK